MIFDNDIYIYTEEVRTTLLTKAQSKYMSLRTTIPIAVVRQLNIKEGDKVD